MKLKRYITLLLCLVGLCQVQAQFNTDRITAIGRNALYFEDYVLSIQYFNQVIRVKPYLAEPYHLRAIAKAQLGDSKGALADADRAIHLNPFQHSYYYTRGYIYTRVDSLTLADIDLTHALTLSPEKRSYLLLRADVRSRMQQYDSAMVDLNWLLARDPDNYRLWAEQGLIYLMQDQDSLALDAYNRSLRYGSYFAGDYANRGLANYRLHNYRASLADYDEAIRLDPENTNTVFNRGMLRQELGDYDRALEDYNTAIADQPNRSELRYQRGVLLLQLRKSKEALADFDAMISAYPTFVPSYYLAAQASDQLSRTKEAYRYRKAAYDIEQQQGASTKQSQPHTGAQVTAAMPKEHESQHTEHVSAQNGNPSDLINCPNVVLSYYDNARSIRLAPYSHLLVEQLNASHTLPARLRFTTKELALTADMVNMHFAQISQLTERIDLIRGMKSRSDELASLFFARAIEDALVQDYVSAIEDATQAIRLRPEDKNIVQTFCRANWRFKLLEYLRSTGELGAATSIDFEVMLRDYDFVMDEQPDFVYAAYNKANMLCLQKNFEDAIAHYTVAIDEDADFAEAYFNRGLTRIHLGQISEGMADLSRAGEMGISQAYELMTRINK